MEATAIIAIVELVMKYGPTAATALISGLNTDNPTPDQIRALKVKDPESYFGNQGRPMVGPDNDIS